VRGLSGGERKRASVAEASAQCGVVMTTERLPPLAQARRYSRSETAVDESSSRPPLEVRSCAGFRAVNGNERPSPKPYSPEPRFVQGVGTMRRRDDDGAFTAARPGTQVLQKRDGRRSPLVRGLSGGERKRASVAEALLARASVLLLDGLRATIRAHRRSTASCFLPMRDESNRLVVVQAFSRALAPSLGDRNRKPAEAKGESLRSQVVYLDDRDAHILFSAHARRVEPSGRRSGVFARASGRRVDSSESMTHPCAESGRPESQTRRGKGRKLTLSGRLSR
jgi:hypothetical protein